MSYTRYLTLAVVALLQPTLGASDVFTDSVAPILASRCLSCHDDANEEGGISLTDPTTLVSEGYVEPGNPNARHLLDLITPDGTSAAMPKDADPLSQKQRAFMTTWIASGANIPDGFRLRPPAVSDRDWWSLQPIAPSRTALSPESIDAHLSRGHHAKGLNPLPPADALTLIRRVSYDLTGLPPTPQQIDDFLAADQRNREQAWRDLVDRLLDSPEFGEKFAQHWLDLARYAETHGYDKDKPRNHAWPYRDYVIASFNQDKPVGDFVREQIAGDTLASDRSEGIAATGFLAAGPWDFIGHVEVGEKKLDGRIAKHLDRDEMVSAVFNVFQSTTVQCAQCHHHKFDPIRSEDYYRLHAVFAAVDRADRIYTGRTPEQSERAEQLTAELTRLRKQESQIQTQRDQAVAEPLAEIDAAMSALKIPESFPVPDRHGFHSLIESSPDRAKWVEIDLGSAQPLDTIELIACFDNFNNIGEGFGFPLRFRVDVDQSETFSSESARCLLEATDSDYPNPLSAPVRVACDGEPVRLIRVTATKLAERQSDYILALGEIRALLGDENRASGATVRFSDAIGKNARWSPEFLVDDQFYGSGIDATKLQQRTELKRRRNRIIAESPLTGTLSGLRGQITQVEQQLGQIPAGQPVYAIATQFKPAGNFKPTSGSPRTIHVLHRGDLRSPGDPVLPGAPKLWDGAPTDFVNSSDYDEADARAELARYITANDNPLLWRSMANRIWQWVMGQPIVATPNDFGRMGAKPTHPELLDHLAASLRDDPHQSMKSLVRSILLTSAYRRASGVTDDVIDSARNAKLDASNQQLWKHDRRRLTAEEFRDTLLVVAGVLNRDARGGPSFQDFVIESPQHSPHYEYHLHDPGDAASHRRTVYRFVVRSQPQPMLTTLDCADPSISTPKRDESTTSLQALTQWNSRLVASMSQQFAERLERDSDSLDGRIDSACRMAWGRLPTTQERDLLKQLGQADGLPTLCRVIFNASATLYLD